jgi:hypothetical protein
MKRSLSSSADEERATKRHRTETQEEEEERDLTKGLNDDVIVEIGRALVYDSIDALKISLLADGMAPDVDGDIDDIKAGLIHYPVARLLTMCNTRLRDLIRRGLPILEPLDGYEEGSAIRMAWYAWFAGARSLHENMFIKRTAGMGASPTIDQLRFTPTSHDGHVTWFGGKMKPTSWQGIESRVPRVLTAAATHFGHEENMRLLYDHYARYEYGFSAVYCLAYRYKDENEVIPSTYFSAASARARIAFAQSPVDISFIGTGDVIEQLHNKDTVSSICINGRLNVMDAAWACIYGKDLLLLLRHKNGVIYSAWRALFMSPIGSESRAAHDWLHARIPFPLSGKDIRAIPHYTATSDQWLRDRELDKRSTCFRFRPYQRRSAFAYALANGDVVALGHAPRMWSGHPSPAQLTFGELKRYTSLAVGNPRMLEWLRCGAHGIRSMESIKLIVDATTTVPDQLILFARSYLAAPRHTDFISLFYDRILDTATTRADGIAALVDLFKATAEHADFASICFAVDYIRRVLSAA